MVQIRTVEQPPKVIRVNEVATGVRGGNAELVEKLSRAGRI